MTQRETKNDSSSWEFWVIQGSSYQRKSRFDCILFLCKLLVTNIKDLPICVHILGLDISSSILGSDEFLISHLSRFLEPVAGSHSRWSLCWRASSHGWSSSAFHSYCNGKPKTVTIIRKDQFVFGGYTDVSWGENLINNDKLSFIYKTVKLSYSVITIPCSFVAQKTT